MNDEKFAPINNTDAVSAEDLLAQVDALLDVEEGASQTEAPEAPAPESFATKAPAQPQAFAPETPAQAANVQAYAAPAGYELRYAQTPQGYQPVYIPIQPPLYAQPYAQAPYAQSAPAPQPQPYSQSAPSAAPRSKSNRREAASASAGAAKQHRRNAVKARPRKKPWGKILGATVLSVAIVALVVWGVVAGATALIRRMGENRVGNYGGGYYDDGYYGGDSWNGMGGYDGGSYYIDEDGNIINEHGWIIGNIHDGGHYTDENGNTVIISPIVPGDDQNDSSVYIEGDASYYFVHADGGLNLRDDPEGNRIANIPNGYPVRVLGWKGDWAYVAYDSYNDTALGWVNADYLFTEPAQKSTKYYVHAGGGLNMRDKPSTTGQRLLTIPEGEVVYAQAYFDDWVFVSYQGDYGWVSGEYISTSASKPSKPSQDNTGSSGGYTMAEIEAAMADAKAYYRSRKGKTPSGGLRGDSLTDKQVEDLYWEAVGLVVGMQYSPAGQFENNHGMMEPTDGYGFFYQVSDPNIKTMEDWADLFYSTLTDDLACDILCGTPMFMLDGKMYISGGAMGDEGLATQYTTRVEAEPGGYKFIMDVVNIREDYYTGATERMEWTFTAHCFKEDGVWVFDDADTPYR